MSKQEVGKVDLAALEKAISNEEDADGLAKVEDVAAKLKAKLRPSVVDVRLVIRSREAAHGDLAIYAALLRRFQDVARDGLNWAKASDAHKVAIDEMLRALTGALVGDPDLRDHYDTIAGYATSAAERLIPRS